MKIFISGQKSFGVAATQMIISEGHEVTGIAAPAFRGPGEGGQFDPLRQLAHRLGIPWVNSADLRSSSVPPCDLIVSAHSHAYLSTPTRRRAHLGAIGYHPSLLPLHRGRDAVRWTVHARERVTGGTVFWLDSGVDTGPIAKQAHVFVRPGESASELWRRSLFPLGIDLLRETLRDLRAGILVRVPQEEDCATWEPSWDRPPLHKPELLQIGPPPEGFRVVAVHSRANS